MIRVVTKDRREMSYQMFRLFSNVKDRQMPECTVVEQNYHCNQRCGNVARVDTPSISLYAVTGADGTARLR